MLSDDKLKLLFEFFFVNINNFTEVILNLLLVCYGVRPAFLYEEANYIKYNINCTQLFIRLVEDINDIGCLKLKTKKDTFTRIFVYLDDESRSKIYPEIYPVDNIIETNPDSVNNDREIAKMLDFNCIDHDNYRSNEIDRISIHVNVNNISDKNNTYNIKAEACEASKFNQKEAEDKYLEFQKKINNIINEYNFECFYKITYLFNSQTKLDMLKSKNIEFILEYLDEYLEDLENYYISDEV